ncbi:MAG: emp24/gp25L/p24 family protein [Chloroflexi bacterium]|nr:emp24/gp25L/p24 family protein [Chloroflexota bacterium]
MKRLILVLATLFLITASASCESPEPSLVAPKPASKAGQTPEPASVPVPSPTLAIATPRPFTRKPLATPQPTPTSTPSPTPTPAPAPPLTTTELLALVVESGKMEKLTLWLDAADKVDGKITVIPQEIDFIVKDPNGDIALNTGPITEKAFSFIARARGNHQLLFLDNSTPSVPSKVVSLQLQHPGAARFPYFAGTYLAFKPREVKTINATLFANQELKASFKVQGGQQDLGFSVRGPDASWSVLASKVYDSRSSTFTASVSGTYQLRFDNSFSSASKLVSLEMFTNPAGEWQSWWGIPVKLSFSTSPAGGIAGLPFTTQPVVTVLDGNGDKVPAFSGEVTLAITQSTGTSGAKFMGTKNASVVDGVATFSGLGINLPGSRYTLTATSGSLFSAISKFFNVSSTSEPYEEVKQFTLDVAVMPARGGTVTLSPDGRTHIDDTVVTLTAVPSQGYKFVGWGGNLSGTVNPVNIIMDSNKRVTVSFVPLSWQ